MSFVVIWSSSYKHCGTMFLNLLAVILLSYTTLPYPTLTDPTRPYLTLADPTRTCPTLPYLTLADPTLPYSTVPDPTLPRPDLDWPYPTLPYPTWPYPTMLCQVEIYYQHYGGAKKCVVCILVLPFPCAVCLTILSFDPPFFAPSFLWSSLP